MLRRGNDPADGRRSVCRAGLFSYAFRKEGFEIVQAVESDEFAAESFRSNLGNVLIGKDILDATPIDSCDVLIAGPPCQGVLDPRKEESVRLPQLVELGSTSVGRHGAPTGGGGRERRSVPGLVALSSACPGTASSWLFGRCGRSQRLGLRSAAKARACFLGGHAHQACLRGAASRDRPSQSGGGLERTRRRAGRRESPRSPCANRTRAESHAYATYGGDKRDILRLAPELAAPSWFRYPNAVTDVWGADEMGRTIEHPAHMLPESVKGSVHSSRTATRGDGSRGSEATDDSRQLVVCRCSHPDRATNRERRAASIGTKRCPAGSAELL